MMDDLIRRSDAIEVAIAAVDEWDGGYNNSREEIIRNAMKNILPVTGHWIILDDIWTKCSECGIMFKDVYDFDNHDSYCRHCGARMEGLKYE